MCLFIVCLLFIDTAYTQIYTFFYLFNFFYEGFYKNEVDEKISKLKNFLDGLFKLHKVKTESELDMLIEMYRILENNLTVSK